MALRKGTPGKGGNTRTDSFSYVPVAPGLKSGFTGWLAGEPYWCDEAHEHSKADPGTKPCLHWMTEGQLDCPRCRRVRPVRCIGWVPLYREQDHKPIIVIVHESAASLLAKLAHPTMVLVGRVAASDSVFVRRNDTQTLMRTESDARKSPVDITRDLLMMWNIPALTEWTLKHRDREQASSDSPVSLKMRLSVPPPTTRIEGLAIDAEKKAPASWDDAVQESLKGAQRRKKAQDEKGDAAPSLNGQHKRE